MNRDEREALEQRNDHIEKQSEETMDEERLRLARIKEYEDWLDEDCPKD